MSINTEWRVINGCPDYAVSNDGRVKRLTPGKRTRTDRERKTYLSRKGYVYVSIRDAARKVKGFQVHRLVAEAFFGPSPLQVNHRNGDKTDNRLGNLEYVTAHENSLHAYLVLNVGQHGERHHNAKLTPADIAEIWRLHDIGFNSVELSRGIRCTPENIQLILRGKAWRRESVKLGRIPAAIKVSSH